MLQQQVYLLNTILMVADALCIFAAGYSAFFIKYHLYDGMWHFSQNIFNLSVFVVMMMNNYVMGRAGLYSDRRRASYLGLGLQVSKSILIDFALLSAIVFLLGQKNYSRFFLLAFMGLSAGYIYIVRAIFMMFLNHSLKNGFNLRNILVVGDSRRGAMVVDLLNQQLSMGHRVIGRLAVSPDDRDSDGVIGQIEDFARILRRQPVDEVVFALGINSRSLGLGKYLAACKTMGIPVRILPALWEQGEQSISVESCQKVPFLTLRVDNFNATGLLYKRLLDIAGGLVGILLLIIFGPFIALAIKLDAPGPIIFKQKRMGRNGRVFNLYKFRTMVANAENLKQGLIDENQMKGSIFKLENDPRITRIGKWLRTFSIDETPQFFNVLKGEMSLVGTRPPTLDEVEAYQPQHLKRISAKPGMTGLWQVSGRNKITDFNKIVELDCRYLDNWRFIDDLKILFKTLFVVFARRGAY